MDFYKFLTEDQIQIILYRHHNTMKQLHTANIFDAALTPSTAKFKGYEYVEDVILDKGKQKTEEFLKMLEENNFKLGIPKENKHAYYGLYIPVAK